MTRVVEPLPPPPPPSRTHSLRPIGALAEGSRTRSGAGFWLFFFGDGAEA